MEDGREWEGKENEEGPKRERRSSSEGGRKTYLDDLVPSGGDDDGVQGVGGESNAGDPGRRRKRSEHGEGGKGGRREEKEERDAHHSECPSSLMSNLHSPRVFQSLMVRSRDPETICRLSAEKETLEERKEEEEREVSFLLLVLLLRLSSSLRSFSYE